MLNAGMHGCVVQPAQILIVMGISGSGKSTVGQALAQTWGWVFVEGDRWHPTSNVAKMSRGEALTDRDRLPWLHALRRVSVDLQAQGQPAIMTCSALKRRYRDLLRGTPPDPRVQFVYLQVDAALARSRLTHRRHHFMPAQLLASQCATLEEPTPDEALILNVNAHTTTAILVENIQKQMGLCERSLHD